MFWDFVRKLKKVSCVWTTKRLDVMSPDVSAEPHLNEDAASFRLKANQTHISRKTSHITNLNSTNIVHIQR